MMFISQKIPVALESCRTYIKEGLIDTLDHVLSAVNFSVSRGSVALLKPNLVSVTTVDHHGCTSAQFVSAAARWFLDHGVTVKVGDSPAFGSARMVMRSTGMLEALKGLDVEVVNFNRARKIYLPCGLAAPVSKEALDCDVLVNLPKLKAHNQLYVSLAVKNYFGVVCGWKKALHHAIHGDIENRFEALLVDLPGLFPNTLTITDGITAMHKTGPIRGEAYQLGLVGAAIDPVALENSLMQIIGADKDKSIIMQECIRRSMPGIDQANIHYPLAQPDQLAVDDFKLPATLTPVTFHPLRMAASGCRRMISRIRCER